MKDYYVEILWGSKKGNPCVKRETVYANSPEEALQYLSDKVRQYKRFSKLHGGSANQVYFNYSE